MDKRRGLTKLSENQSPLLMERHVFNRRMLGYVLAALSVGGFAALYNSFRDKDVLEDVGGYIFDRLTYYTLMLLVGIWIAQIVIVLRKREFSMKAFVGRQWPELLMALAATVAVWWSVPPQFRVLSDEANLVSVSGTMFYDKTVFNTVKAQYYYGNMQSVKPDPDSKTPPGKDREKRPFLFSFFTHLLHLIRGFNGNNGFLCNGIMLFALLSMAAIIAQRYVGRVAAAAAVLLLAGYPLISLYSMCAGFDFIAAFFMMLTFVTLAVFMRDPSADTFALLWITALVFAHTRYESGVAFALIVFLLAILGFVQFEHFSRHFHIYILTPWFISPLILQRLILGNQFENNTGTPNFSKDHFIENSCTMVKSLWDYHRMLPYPTVLNDIAVISLPFVIYAVIRYAAPPARQFLAVATVVLLVFLGILLSYYFGKCDHPSSARFFLFVSIIAAMLPVAFCYFFPKFMSQNVLLAIAIVSAAYYHPVAVENRFTQTQILIREVEAEYAFLNTLKNKDFLIVVDRPVDFTCLGYGAVDYTYANNHIDEIMAGFHNRLYAILLFQRVQINSYMTLPQYQFKTMYAPNAVKELEITGPDDLETGGYYIRISWVGGLIP